MWRSYFDGADTMNTTMDDMINGGGGTEGGT
jgi:ribose 5-phosphate isomerase